MGTTGWLLARGGATALKDHPRVIGLRGQAGNSLIPVGLSNNSVDLETAPHGVSPTDAAIVTYDLFRAAMLAIIEAWDVT